MADNAAQRQIDSFNEIEQPYWAFLFEAERAYSNIKDSLKSV